MKRGREKVGIATGEFSSASCPDSQGWAVDGYLSAVKLDPSITRAIMIRFMVEEADFSVLLYERVSFVIEEFAEKEFFPVYISDDDEYGWVKRLRRKIRILYRRRTAYIKSSHQAQINRLLDGVTEVIIEPMRFTALQKRSSKTERSEKASTVQRSDGSTVCVHKFKRKKRFGHSMTNHSPGLFQSELKRKALKLDIPYFEIQTQKYKASQYHHDTGEYTSAGLDDRYKEIVGHTVQRDLYSAFLIAHTDDTLCHPDDAACDRDFPRFVTLHDHELSAMKASDVSNKACWGF